MVRYEPRHGKTNNVVSKPSCTSREDGKKLEILDLERRGIVLWVQQKQRR